jgi:hypothetical protein
MTEKIQLYVPRPIDDEAAAILYTVLCGQIYDGWGWTSIGSRTLKGIVGNEYPEVLESLEESDLIRRNLSYKSGEGGFCREYQVLPTHDMHFVKITKKRYRKQFYQRLTGADNRLCKQVQNRLHELWLDFDDADAVAASMISEGELVDAARSRIAVGLFAGTHRGKVRQDGFSRRIHHPVSMMKRELRRLLQHPDGELVTIDAHASQAFIIAFLARDTACLEICSQGLFWKELGGYTLTSEKKDWLKKQVYRQFYGGRSTILADRYPILNSFLTGYQGREKGRELCQQAQTIEREIFIKDVLTGLYRDDVFAVPIHDAIMCLKKDEELVSDRIRLAIEKRTGVTPFIAS